MGHRHVKQKTWKKHKLLAALTFEAAGRSEYLSIFLWSVRVHHQQNQSCLSLKYSKLWITVLLNPLLTVSANFVCQMQFLQQVSHIFSGANHCGPRNQNGGGRNSELQGLKRQATNRRVTSQVYCWWYHSRSPDKARAQACARVQMLCNLIIPSQKKHFKYP